MIKQIWNANFIYILFKSNKVGYNAKRSNDFVPVLRSPNLTRPNIGNSAKAAGKNFDY